MTLQPRKKKRSVAAVWHTTHRVLGVGRRATHWTAFARGGLGRGVASVAVGGMGCSRAGIKEDTMGHGVAGSAAVGVARYAATAGCGAASTGRIER
jgi:hypothetical protein